MGNKIETATQQFDERIGHYTKPLYIKIVSALQPDLAVLTSGEEALTTTLHMARFVDLHFETGDLDFLDEAYRLEKELYVKLPDTTDDLERIKNETIGFFDIEKHVWKKVQSGQSITDEEFKTFRVGKSSDARYYARVVQEFVGRDVTNEIYSDMQLMDILADIQEYEQDSKNNNPNLLYILLCQHAPLEQIPETKAEAIQLARSLGIHEELITIAESLVESAQNSDYTGIEFLREESEKKLEDIEKELGENLHIRKGIRYLLQHQIPSGEFPTSLDIDPSFSNPQPITNVFNTAVILHALLPFKDNAKVHELSQKAIKWLIGQQNISGYWNFFGESVQDLPLTEQIPPDIDTNSYILSVLKDWGVQLSNNTFFNNLMKNRNKQGLFITWIPGTSISWDPEVEPYVNNEEIDPVVNANAAYLCCQEMVKIPEVMKYLEEKIVTGEFDRPSNYYLSPTTFLYAVSKLIRFNPQFAQGEVGEACRKKAMSLIDGSGTTTPLEIALAVSAALNGFMQYPDPNIDAAVAQLETQQGEEGSWNAYPFYKGYLNYYGSRELTTALVIEAMALEQRHMSSV